MQFIAKNLGDKFKDIIDWMMQQRFGQEIRDTLQRCQSRKVDLSNNADAESALRLLIEIKITKSFHLPLPAPKASQFQADFDSFTRRHAHNLRTSQAKADLASLIANHSTLKVATTKAQKWVDDLLGSYPTLSAFTHDLYTRRKTGQKVLLGPKGADLYLRDLGFFDRAPIDLHEERFVVRTGIFHAFSVQGRQDPRDYGCIQDALNIFCSICLRGKTFEGMDLGFAPGIVDLFIWYYCADGKYQVCGSVPRCEECELRSACLYALASIQNVIARNQTMVEYGLDGAEMQRVLQQTQISKPAKAARGDKTRMRQWARQDPNGAALWLKEFAKDRGLARRYLRYIGLSPGDADHILSLVEW